MGGMSGRDVREGPHAEGIPAGDAAPPPGLRRQIAEEGDSREADPAELLDVTGPRDLVGASRGGADLLVVARERAVEAAGEPECAGDEHALGVVDVTDDLPDAPLLRRVTVKRLLLGHAGEERGHLLELSSEDADDVAARNPIDIAEIVGRGFALFRRSDHPINLTAAMARRLQLQETEASMKRVDLTLPEFMFIVSTRAFLAAGSGRLPGQLHVEIDLPAVVEIVALLRAGHPAGEPSSEGEVPGESLDLQFFLRQVEDPLAAQHGRGGVVDTHLDRLDRAGTRRRLVSARAEPQFNHGPRLAARVLFLWRRVPLEGGDFLCGDRGLHENEGYALLVVHRDLAVLQSDPLASDDGPGQALVVGTGDGGERQQDRRGERTTARLRHSVPPSGLAFSVTAGSYRSGFVLVNLLRPLVSARWVDYSVAFSAISHNRAASASLAAAGAGSASRSLLKYRPVTPSRSGEDARRTTGRAPFPGGGSTSPRIHCANFGAARQMPVAMAPGCTALTAMPGSRRASSRVKSTCASFVFA